MNIFSLVEIKASSLRELYWALKIAPHKMYSMALNFFISKYSSTPSTSLDPEAPKP